ncbi:MAG: YveK family protein [Bacillota bacterium]
MEIYLLLNSFRKGWKSILTLTGIFAVTAALVVFFLLPPSYQASSLVMVVPKDFLQQNSLMQYSDILTAHHQLTQMYEEIAQSRSVAEKVIYIEKLKETPEEFKERVATCRLSNTGLIQIIVKDKDPYRAQRIANTLTKVFMEKIEQVMKIDSLTLVEEASLPTEPQDQKSGYAIAVAGIIGFLIAVSRIILVIFLDSTVKTAEDLSKFLKLPVLGVISKNPGGVYGFSMREEKL